MKIYLDDLREQPSGWTLARTFQEFKQLIDSGEPIEAIAFDHDLGEGEPEGYDIVKWLAEYKPEVILSSEITSHSANPVGRENIETFVASCRRNPEALLEMHRPSGENRG